MTPRFPKNEMLRAEALMFSLFKTFQKLPGKENLPPEMVASVIANAAAMFAADHGISLEKYLEMQAAMLAIEAERRK